MNAFEKKKLDNNENGKYPKFYILLPRHFYCDFHYLIGKMPQKLKLEYGFFFYTFSFEKSICKIIIICTSQTDRVQIRNYARVF